MTIGQDVAMSFVSHWSNCSIVINTIEVNFYISKVLINESSSSSSSSSPSSGLLRQALSSCQSTVQEGSIGTVARRHEYPLLSQERVKLRTSTFVRAFIGQIGTKAL